MSLSLADARFLFDRALGLLRRGATSLRTRGWRASWARAAIQLRRNPEVATGALSPPRSIRACLW